MPAKQETNEKRIEAWRGSKRARRIAKEGWYLDYEELKIKRGNERNMERGLAPLHVLVYKKLIKIAYLLLTPLLSDRQSLLRTRSTKATRKYGMLTL
jgi:hypothetical protein